MFLNRKGSTISDPFIIYLICTDAQLPQLRPSDTYATSAVLSTNLAKPVVVLPAVLGSNSAEIPEI